MNVDAAGSTLQSGTTWRLSYEPVDLRPFHPISSLYEKFYPRNIKLYTCGKIFRMPRSRTKILLNQQTQLSGYRTV
jgi:hypothetical protein